jgi:hypothetical protein
MSNNKYKIIALGYEDEIYLIINSLRSSHENESIKFFLLSEKLEKLIENRKICISYAVGSCNKKIFLNKISISKLQSIFIHGGELREEKTNIAEYMSDIFVEKIDNICIWEYIKID